MREEKELELAVYEVLTEMGSLGENDSMDGQKIVDVLRRCSKFINYCKFEFGEDITEV